MCMWNLLGIQSLSLLSLIQGNGRLKVYDIEAKCFECDIKITESRHGKSARLVSLIYDVITANQALEANVVQILDTQLKMVTTV